MTANGGSSPARAGCGLGTNAVRLLKLLLILCVYAGGPAAAEPLEDAIAAARKGDYATALRLFGPLADQGNAVAQYNLGLMYGLGRGVPQDHAAAVSWYRKAAEQSYAGGQYNLGVMYERAQGVPQDYAAAVSWYRKAAEQGHARAQHNLGVMYVHGRGVPLDYVQACKWFNLASSRSDASDKESRDSAVRNRDIVAAKMTPAQIAAAQKLAREWKPKPDDSRP
jgi:TPR repeat protein